MAATGGSKARSIALWVFKSIVALLFIVFGAFKLAGAPMSVHEFEVIGLGQWFRLVTGLTEVGGAVLLIVPATSRFGALALLGVSVGACIAQATVLHQDVIHTIVLIGATGFLVWLGWRPQASARVAAA